MSHEHSPFDQALTKDESFNFSTFFIKNPITTIIIVLILTLLGIRAFTKMPLELFPNIEFPVVIVNTVYPGAAPAEVETLVTKPIEDALAGINGLKALHSTSKDGVSSVVCEFELEVNNKDASNDVRDKVSAISYKLPKDARPPAYMTWSSSNAPIVNYTITANMTDVAVSTYLKNLIKPKLEQLSGVAQIQLLGNAERSFEVSLNPERLQAYSLSLPGVFQTIQAENYNLPGGKVDMAPRELSLRTMGKFSSVEDLGHLYIPTPTGAQVQLNDLGTIRDTVKDRTTYASIDGQEAVFFSVLKQTDANSVDVVKKVDQKLEELKPTFPAGMKVVKAFDTSEFVTQSNEAVWEHLAIGAILAVIVLFIFLRNVAAMIISGLAIPLSIVMAFVPMQALGFTFNNITMMALSLVVGILVDDAVVDLENIYRHMEKGENPLKAAINATGEIQLAVTATTMTIVGVFLPMSFMSGYIGKFFRSFGLTVTFAVLFSLLIARTLTPMLSAYLLKVKPKPGHVPDEEDGDLNGRYPKLLAWSLRHRWVVVAVATVTFIGGMSLTPFIQKGFMPSSDRGEFVLRIKMPTGTVLAETKRVANQVASRVKQLPEVEHAFVMIGQQGAVDEARVDVMLVDKSQRKRSDNVVAKEARELFATMSGARVMADTPGMVAGASNKPVQILVQGDNLDELRMYSDKFATALHQVPMFVDVETSLGQERSELRIQPDRARMAQYGIQAMSLANTLRLATTGDTPNTMSAGPDEVDVWVRLDPAYRKDANTLGSLTIQGQRGSVPLSAVAAIQPGGGFAQIERKDRQRLVQVTANLIPGVSVGTATDYIDKNILPKLDLPPSITVDMSGQAEQQRDSFSGFGQAMVMGILLIFFILALQFSSFLHPFTIMFSLPLAIIGAMLGLILFGKELGMMSLIGIIMLMGIVTKNAILIVDFVLTMRDRGYSRTEAVMRGAQVRLRPILMTTAAMVLGMLPMALGIGAGAEFRSPMAVVVIGGLLTSTGLTLVVVPVAYTLMDDLKEFFMHRVLRRKSPPPAQETSVARAMVD